MALTRTRIAGLSLSAAALVAIANFEGFRDRAYDDGVFDGRRLRIGHVAASSKPHPEKTLVLYAESVTPFERATCSQGVPSERFATMSRFLAWSCCGIQQQFSDVYPNETSMRSMVRSSEYPEDIAHA
jgi:hypothetical protein